MKIWRIENDDYRGIYHGILHIQTEINYLGISSRHPAPLKDSMFAENAYDKGFDFVWSDDLQAYYYGFSSPEQLLNWFYNYDDLIRFEYAGFHVTVIESNDVIEGNTQCAFCHVGCTRVQQHSMCEFLDLYGKV